MHVDGEPQFTRICRLLSEFANSQNVYHHQKERMAHAGLVVQIALTSAIWATDWPPEWMHQGSSLLLILSPFGVLAMSAWVHFFIRWQLTKRTYAAIAVAAAWRVLLDWSHTEPSPEDLVQFVPMDQPSKKHELLKKLAWIVPCRYPATGGDVGRAGFPVAFVNEERAQRTGAYQGEMLVSVSSLVLIGLTALRLFT